jgi:hypothetical protein
MKRINLLIKLLTINRNMMIKITFLTMKRYHLRSLVLICLSLVLYDFFCKKLIGSL